MLVNYNAFTYDYFQTKFTRQVMAATTEDGGLDNITDEALESLTPEQVSQAARKLTGDEESSFWLDTVGGPKKGGRVLGLGVLSDDYAPRSAYRPSKASSFRSTARGSQSKKFEAALDAKVAALKAEHDASLQKMQEYFERRLAKIESGRSATMSTPPPPPPSS